MDIVGLMAVLGAFGLPMYAIKQSAETKRKRHQLALGPGTEVTAKLIDENKLLRERVENVESIVCGVDLDLNRKRARVIEAHQSLMIQPGGVGPMQVAT